MAYQTLVVTEIAHGLSVTLNRIAQRNSLNSAIMTELHQVLDQAEKNPAYKLIILKGQQGIFCTGMDFQEVSKKGGLQKEDADEFAKNYMALLKRFATIPKVIIAHVDGQVLAGGVGLVAASDVVIATSKSQFCLSEALWGLLPANVLPYLIRRAGFQKSYLMTLTTQTISATEAHTFQLVDELSDQPEEVIRKLIIRLARLDSQTIHDLKSYFRKLWIVDERVEQIAADELARLMQEPKVLNNIKRYVEQGKFPWETADE